MMRIAGFVLGLILSLIVLGASFFSFFISGLDKIAGKEMTAESLQTVGATLAAAMGPTEEPTLSKEIEKVVPVTRNIIIDGSAYFTEGKARRSPGVFIGAMTGLGLCIPWLAACLRSMAYFHLTAAQVREAQSPQPGIWSRGDDKNSEMAV